MTASTRIRRIVLATDFSPASGKAFGAAVALARASGARLTVLHVIAPFFPVVPEQYMDRKSWDRFDRLATQAAMRKLGALAGRANKARVRATPRLLRGDPAIQIVRGTRSQRADLLVVGTHGRTGVSRLFMGSVAARVLAMAPCPVVTVRR